MDICQSQKMDVLVRMSAIMKCAGIRESASVLTCPMMDREMERSVGDYMVRLQYNIST